MQIDVNGVKITLTNSQLEEINKQIKKNRPITERIQSIEDVYSEIGKTRNLPYKNPSSKIEKSLNASYDLLHIAEAYNEGIVLDWFNYNQYKYFPYKYTSGLAWLVALGGGWYGRLCCPAGLYYKSSDLSKDAYNKFTKIFDDYFMI